MTIVGFVQFLRGYYLILGTERTLLGKIAGHATYGITNTSIVQIWRPEDPPVETSIFGKLKQGKLQKCNLKVEMGEARCNT